MIPSIRYTLLWYLIFIIFTFSSSKWSRFCWLCLFALWVLRSENLSLELFTLHKYNEVLILKEKWNEDLVSVFTIFYSCLLDYDPPCSWYFYFVVSNCEARVQPVRCGFSFPILLLVYVYTLLSDTLWYISP